MSIGPIKTLAFPVPYLDFDYPFKRFEPEFKDASLKLPAKDLEASLQSRSNSFSPSKFSVTPISPVLTIKEDSLVPENLTEIVAELNSNPSIERLDQIKEDLILLVEHSGVKDDTYSCTIRKASLEDVRQIAKNLLAQLTIKNATSNEPFSITTLNGSIHFSVEAAIVHARKNDLDEGRFLAESLGLNPEVVRPGIVFNYHGRNSLLSTMNVNHPISVDRSRTAVEEMIALGEERIKDRYRIYSAGKYLDEVSDRETLWYPLHEIGHDIFFSSLTDYQRREFIEIIQKSQARYKSRIIGSNYIQGKNENFDFTQYSHEQILRDSDLFISVSEAFALSLQNHIGFPVSSGRDHHKYLNHPESLELTDTFFRKYDFKLSSSTQPSLGDVTANIVLKSTGDYTAEFERNKLSLIIQLFSSNPKTVSQRYNEVS